ncbi:hypothetical protein M231_06950 [Tremella mesenterica]|uniref:Uncharacterized protein n=1 Tax=Tremella mesenterica TaxID=5217 RepID=A0A4Q1BD62_TREME|nr:hypothetical protein M231_06950 [Tremella mesenterica]
MPFSNIINSAESIGVGPKLESNRSRRLSTSLHELIRQGCGPLDTRTRRDSGDLSSRFPAIVLDPRAPSSPIIKKEESPLVQIDQMAKLKNIPSTNKLNQNQNQNQNPHQNQNQNQNQHQNLMKVESDSIPGQIHKRLEQNNQLNTKPKFHSPLCDDIISTPTCPLPQINKIGKENCCDSLKKEKEKDVICLCVKKGNEVGQDAIDVDKDKVEIEIQINDSTVVSPIQEEKEKEKEEEEGEGEGKGKEEYFEHLENLGQQGYETSLRQLQK